MEVKALVVFITAPVDKAPELAELIVKERLGACVNRVERVFSTYWWEGKIERDEEGLLIVKTTPEVFEKLLKRVKEVHPYCVPEIIALPVVAGNEDYLKWVREEVSKGS